MKHSSSSPTILTTLTPASIAAIEAAASAQYGIRLVHVPEAEPEKLQKPIPKPAKPAKKAAQRSPPTGEELASMILTSADTDGFVQAAEFYNRWPDDQAKRAKARVSAVLGKLVQAGKLAKEGHAQHTVYRLKKA